VLPLQVWKLSEKLSGGCFVQAGERVKEGLQTLSCSHIWRERHLWGHSAQGQGLLWQPLPFQRLSLLALVPACVLLPFAVVSADAPAYCKNPLEHAFLRQLLQSVSLSYEKVAACRLDAPAASQC